MKNDEPVGGKRQEEQDVKNLLEQILREGARRLLQAAIESEVTEYVERCKNLKDDKGRRMVVKNSKARERTSVTGIGPIRVRQRRVNDKREGSSFTSAILPRYMRRVLSLDSLIPTLYLKGIAPSTAVPRTRGRSPGAPPRTRGRRRLK